MKQIKETSNISRLMEKLNMDKNGDATNILETKQIGNKLYGILIEGSKYIIKYADYQERKEYLEEDFHYINGVQNREKYLADGIINAKKKLNYILNESIHSSTKKMIKEGDEKYVIKKDAPNPDPTPDADVNMNVDDADINMDAESDEDVAPEVEADLDEYQELTGKLTYILRNQDEDGYDDVAKYIFNSLISALDIDKMDSNVANSVKEKFLAQFDDSNEEEGDAVEETLSRTEEPYPGEKHRHVNSDSVVDPSLMESTLQKKGYKIVEKYSKEGLIAFMGQKDVSGVFNQPTKRYEDGEMKNPHEKEGIHPVGDSKPYDENEDPNEINQKNIDKPFVEGMQWENYEEDYTDLEVAKQDSDWKKRKGMASHGMPTAGTLGRDADEPYTEPSLEELLSDNFLKV